jgi:ribosomal protein S18 acetylase RimI-like enzyme
MTHVDALAPIVVAPATAEDSEALLALVDVVGPFEVADRLIVAELLETAFSNTPASAAYTFLVARDGQALKGFACYGPTPLTSGTFDLYWIGVARDAQGRGVGSALLKRVEQEVCARGARLLLIETESRDAYRAAQRFYERHGWTLEARIRDFYAPGNHRLLYAKRYASAVDSEGNKSGCTTNP